MSTLPGISSILANPDLQKQLQAGAAIRYDLTLGKLVLEHPPSSSHKSPPLNPGAPSEGIIKQTPPYLRLPKSGQRCPYTGLTRSMLDSLVRPCAANNFRPPVKSSKVKASGTKGRRGAVLVDAQSLMEHLAAQNQNVGLDSSSPSTTANAGGGQ